MKQKIFNYFMIFSLTIITALNTVSCNQDLIPEPEMEKITSGISSNTTLLPPALLTATQGGVKGVTLSWKATSNANQYKIYAAKTPYDNFVQVAETKDSTTQITITEESGTVKYYRVSSVDYSKNESSLSDFVYGSSMATPIITGIDQSEDGTEATLNWWMENCTEDTYLKTVKYEIVVCDSEKKEINRFGIAGQKESLTPVTSYTVTGLSPKTTYFYKIEAFTMQFPDKKEISDMVDAETARRLTPTPAENFTVSKGITQKEITISWTLPEFTDVRTSNGSYERHPVYFTLERKIKGESDKNFVKIAEKISSCVTDTSEENKIYKFDCSKGIPTSGNLTVEPSPNEDSEKNSNYEGYIQHSKLLFKDKNVEQKVQYEYRIQSFVDDERKTISAENCIVKDEGWLISPVEFKTNANYEKDEENKEKFTKITVSFQAIFEDYGIKDTYIYTIKQAFKTLDGDEFNAPEVIYTTEDLKKLQEHKKEFIPTTENKGYYKYSLEVKTKNSETSLCETPASGSIIVTEDAASIKEVENAKVKDGFSDKYEISWDYDSTCKYKIEWSSFDELKNPLTDKNGFIEISENDSNLKIENSTQPPRATYSLPANSGDIREFYITANKGIEKQTKIEDKFFYTLGTVKAKIEKYDYSTIKVSWKGVQKAGISKDSYEVSAKYKDETAYSENLIKDDNIEIAQFLEGSDEEPTYTYTCTITNPHGFNDAKLSGLPIVLSIKAKNTETNSETESSIIVKTIGPAATNTKVITERDRINPANQIRIQWDKVDGACGYIIQRVIYNDKTKDKTKTYDPDKYYYNEIDGKISVNAGEECKDRVKIELDSTKTKYTLTDNYKEASEVGAYQEKQSKLNFGLPVGYIVIPVKEGGNIDDFKFNKFKIEEGSKVVYNEGSDLSDVIGSTYGYGLNVTAGKAENSKTISVKWDKPSDRKDVFPVLYRRASDSNEWTYLESFTNNITSYNDTIVSDDNSNEAKEKKSKAYFYAVQYKPDSASELDYTESYKNHISAEDMRYKDGIKEELNKGYLFYIDFDASYNGTTDENGAIAKNEFYYSQKVSHKKWNFTEKKRGPSSYKIEAKNLNLADDYITIADIKIENGNETFTINATNNILTADGDTNIIQTGTDLILRPNGITNGTATETDGIMKILRSSKTFYKFTATRNFTKDGVSSTVIYETEDYAYRQITDQELAKCVGLIIADAIFKAGIPKKGGLLKYEASTECPGATGKMIFTHTAGSDTFKWSFNNADYRHIFVNGCSSKHTDPYNSELILNGGESQKLKGCKENKIWYIPPLDIKVSSDSNLDSYNCTLNFTAGAEGTSIKWNLTITKDSLPIVSVSNNKSEFLKYFPFNLGETHESKDSTVNNGFPTYNEPFWK